MAVVSVTELSNRAGDEEINTRKRYTRVFQVLTDDPTTGAQAVRDDPAIPAYGDPWEQVAADGVTVTDTDTDAVAVSKRAAQADPDNFQIWQVTVEYVGIHDPTAEPPKVSWTHEKYQVTANKDTFGTPVVNAAGDFYANGMTLDRTRYVVMIEHNVLTFDPILALDLIDTTNDALFLEDRHPPGFAIGKCKLDSIDAEPVYFPGYPVTTDIQYWRRTVKVSLDENGWAVILLNAGFRSFVKGAGGTPVKNPDGTNQLVRIMLRDAPAATPQPLTTDGYPLPQGGTANYTDGTAGLGPFFRYPPANWGALDPPIDY